MTPGQVRIVQESFRRLQPNAAAAGRIFYEKLFRIAPELRRLFPEHMAEQEARLMEMLGWIAANLHDGECIAKAARDLGRRHRGYRVDASHYDQVGEALVMTIRDGLGSDFTNEAEAAWAAAYTSLAKLMREGAAAADREARAERSAQSSAID